MLRSIAAMWGASSLVSGRVIDASLPAAGRRRPCRRSGVNDRAAAAGARPCRSGVRHGRTGSPADERQYPRLLARLDRGGLLLQVIRQLASGGGCQQRGLARWGQQHRAVAVVVAVGGYGPRTLEPIGTTHGPPGKRRTAPLSGGHSALPYSRSSGVPW